MAERDKIGFIGVPWSAVPSTRPGSMGIMFDKVSRMLPPPCQAVVVSGTYAPDPAAEAERVKYNRILDRKDRFILRPLAAFQNMIPGLGCNYHFRSYFHKYYANTAARHLASEGVNAVVFPLYPQWAPLIRAHLPEAKLILWMQCEWLSGGPSWYAKCLDLIDRIVCCSEFIADKVEERFPEAKEKLRVVPNGVDSRLFNPAQDRCRHQVLYAGRLTPEKGAHILLKAFEGIRIRYPDAQLILAGPFWITPSSQLVGSRRREIRRWRRLGRTYEKRIRRDAKKLSHVFLTDHIPHKSLVQIYQTASVFVHPALWNEPFGMILAEAMACGLPVVASRTGGIPEVVQDGRSGLLVEPGDVDGLTAAIERFFENREFASRMGTAARARAAEFFDWKIVAAQIADIALE